MLADLLHPLMAAPHQGCGKFSPRWDNYVPSGLRWCSPVAEGTRQRQNMTKIPKSQTSQACVRHDGAVAEKRFYSPSPKEPGSSLEGGGFPVNMNTVVLLLWCKDGFFAYRSGCSSCQPSPSANDAVFHIPTNAHNQYLISARRQARV